MNSVDYSKALARERDNFQKTISRERDESQKSIESKDNNHRQVQKHQKEKYANDRVELENDYRSSLDDHRNRTEESLDKKYNTYQKNIEKEKETFAKAKDVQRDDYGKKLTDLNESYQRSIDSEKRNNHELLTTQKKSTKETVGKLQNENHKKISDFQSRSEKNKDKLIEDQKIERTELNKLHHNKMEKLQLEESQKRFGVKESLQRDIARNKDSTAQDLNRMDEQSKEQLLSMRKQFDQRADALTESYQDKTSKLTDQTSRQNILTNKGHQEEMAKVIKNHNADFREQEKVFKRRQFGSEEGGISQRQQGANSKQYYVDKLDKQKHAIVNAKSDYQIRYNSDQDKFNDTLADERFNSAEAREKRERQLGEEKIESMAHERDKTQDKLMTMEKHNFLEKDALTNEMTLSQRAASEKVQRLNENFNKSMLQVNEKNIQYVTDLKKQAGTDKAKFISNMEKDRSEEIFELRKNFEKQMDSTVSNYEFRLDQMVNENRKLKDNFEMKLNQVSTDAARENKEQTVLYEEKRLSDQKEFQAMITQKDNDTKAQINSLTNNFQRKLDSQSNQNEVKVKTITTDYESRMKSMSMNQMKELNDREFKNLEEIKKMKAGFESEKNRIVSQYENAIAQLRVSHQEHAQQLANYRKLS